MFGVAGVPMSTFTGIQYPESRKKWIAIFLIPKHRCKKDLLRIETLKGNIGAHSMKKIKVINHH